MHRLTPLAFVLVASCTPEPLLEEGELIDTRDNELEQGLYDCSESTDTGYSQGNAFTITVVTVDGKPVERDTANAYIVMQEVAAFWGINIRIVSGFRTMSQQQYLYGCYVNCNCNNCNLAAQPGYSNHQSGHALDLNTSDPGVLNFLNDHGAEYGFARTVPSEPWHWEWWGGGPGGGPCGADPECLANPNYGGCNGTVVTHCENNRVSTGDCGFFGAGCSVEGGHPHCVHPYCYLNLDGGETGKWCVDGTNVVASCDLGQYSEGDCGFFGCTCSEAGGQGHCVHPMCPANLGAGEENGSFCVEGTNKIGTCNLGAYEEGDCGVFGATCSEAGAVNRAHCVHFMCWSNLEGREDGTLCKDANTLGSCALGAYTETPCAQGCVEPTDGAGNAYCIDERCNEFADTDRTGARCIDDVTLMSCTNGAYRETHCDGGGCHFGDLGAQCVSLTGDDGDAPSQVAEGEGEGEGVGEAIDEGEGEGEAEGERDVFQPSVDAPGCSSTSSSTASMMGALFIAVILAARRRRSGR